MTVAIGTCLGRYEIRSPLGAGGMGEVYLARDTQLDRDVALKILPEHLASDEQRMRRFVHEAKAASALNHPNIITIHEVGQTDSVHFIATELIDGVTLRHLMKKARMTLREAFDIVIQIASALTSSHAAGIVHRDIKPENVMLRSDGYVKVLDFGLAKLIEEARRSQRSDPEAPTASAIETESAVQTEPGVVMGTVAYMSPEQARGLTVDARADIWSFGVVLFEMIAGRRPFGGDTTSDVIASILEREPAPLSRYVPNVPAELERIISKTLAKDTEERYQTVKDLLIDLRRLRKQVEIEVEAGRVRADSGPVPGTDESRLVATEVDSTADTSHLDAGRTTSSAEYIFDGIKHHRKTLFAGLMVLIALTAIFVYVQRKRNTVISSILVLPLANMTGDAGLDDLCDGVTDSVINELSKLQGLEVKPRSTSFRYKGQTIEPQKVGESLGVGAVLAGRIIKRGNTLIVRTELIDVTKDKQLWGEQFKSDQADLIGGASFLTLQEDMTKQILDTLRTKLSGEGFK
jgi:eukaryotic-like serine/threonine-protein kinase